jgi:hypothetical protein
MKKLIDCTFKEVLERSKGAKIQAIVMIIDSIVKDTVNQLEELDKKLKNEISICCNAQVKRGTKIGGYIPYCTNCNKECKVKNS